jgi:uncharacterized membrane protein YeaQ/YmgE (transglycosylase-associated protein family)
MQIVTQVLVWMVIGGLVGSLVGTLVKRDRKGFGRRGNLIIGLFGALIGGALFELLGIDLGLGDVSVSLEDLVAAFVGALIFLVVVRVIQKGKA